MEDREFNEHCNSTVKSIFRRPGFTLVEMLVAMAVTMLMMAALARAFGFVGTRVQESRGDTELSNKLRDMTTRLSDELKQCTVTLEPNGGGEDQLGYFLYYEGPVTNATSSVFRAIADPATGNVNLNDSKYGDFDDYLAFTAVAQGNNWFVGKVPRYILDAKAAEANGVAYTPPTPLSIAFEPVVIRSKYAEIIYYASPEYAPTSLPASPGPTYIDVDGDVDLGSGSATENGLPDRLRIHRRVLLVRPDLNLAVDGALPILSKAIPSTSSTVNFMQADTWPNASTATVTGAADTTLGWLYGMAGVHQQCDLSVRRVLTSTGSPTVRVAANSLDDLSKPHNRFAHVRVPNNVLMGTSGGAAPTSMPVLALGGPATILNMETATASPARIAPPLSPNVGPVVTPNSLSGFLRAEFVLGNDLTHLNDPTDAWGQQRIGEDLLSNNVLGFDVQIYDPTASFFTTSNGLVVGPSDPGYREALQEAIAGSSTAVEFGGFVDLAYPVLAGGALRGWQARRLDRRQTMDSAAIPTTRSYLRSQYSGVDSYASGDTSVTAYFPSLYRSGRLVTNGTTIRLFQPAFDTYTSSYERDGIFQGTTVGTGTLWTTIVGTTTTSAVDAAADGLDNDVAFGIDDQGERETLPPFRARPEAIRATIRIENPSIRLIRQLSVEHRDQL